jgi:glycosyltransferase involved in cell wall biosynthesis
MKTDLWIPSLFESKGGIQVYSAYFLNALQSIFPREQHRVFLKNDTHRKIPITLGSNITYFASGQNPSKLRTVSFANQIIQKAIQVPPNLIISTHLNFIPAAWYLEKTTNIPYWTVAHGIEAWGIKNSLMKTALKNADRILAVSHYTRDKLLSEQQLDPTKVVVLPNTFDSKRFNIASKPQYLLEQYNLRPKQPIILTVARLAEVERYKGYDRIFEALPKIRESIPDIHYVLVGEGRDRPRVERLIAKLGLQDCVTLAGFVPDKQLCDYYNLCDIFAMPSKKEGFGIVYLEAMACGKPCLGGNQDGAIDALCHGELGALVNPDNVEEIAQTLIQIQRKTYPNTIMYEPERLRCKAIEYFGFERFCKTLNTQLQEFSSRMSLLSANS